MSNYIRYIVLCAIIVTAPAWSMGKRKQDDREEAEANSSNKKCKLELPTLQELSIQTIVHSHNDFLEQSTVNNRKKRCNNFWQKVEPLPRDLKIKIFTKLRDQLPTRQKSPMESKKLSIFTSSYETAETNVDKEVIAIIFADPASQNKFSTFDLLPPHKLLLGNTNPGLKKLIIENLTTPEYFKCLTTVTQYYTDNALNTLLTLGMNPNCPCSDPIENGKYTQWPLRTVLDYAIEELSENKISLLVKKGALIPMETRSYNALSHALQVGQKTNRWESYNNIIEYLIQKLGKTVLRNDTFLYIANHSISDQELLIKRKYALPLLQENIHARVIKTYMPTHINVLPEAMDIFTKETIEQGAHLPRES